MSQRGRIIKYLEMCRDENLSLQKGMNFCPRSDHSILLMSLRKGAPYQDRVENDGAILIYEGHDAPRSSAVPNPKSIDQPGFLPSGALTENGKFFEAASRFKKTGEARLVRVYEKLRDGVWAEMASFISLMHTKKNPEAGKFSNLSSRSPIQYSNAERP